MFPQSPEDGRAKESPRRASTGTRIGFAVLMSAGFFVLLWAPQILKTVKVRPAIPVEGLQGQVSGTYVASDKGFFKLYPFPTSIRPFPAQAAAASGKVTLYVRARQLLDDISLYTLHTYAGEEVAVERRRLDDHTIEFVPKEPLPSGRYYMWVTRDSADAGYDYAYFSVDASRQDAGPQTTAVSDQSQTGDGTQ